MFAKVIVDIVHSGVDRLFDYRVPEGMNIRIGYRVRVPFGKANALREGYVLNLTEQSEYDTEKLKDIASVISDFPVFKKGQASFSWVLRRKRRTVNQTQPTNSDQRISTLSR